MTRPIAPRHLAPATRRWFRSIIAEADLAPHEMQMLVMAGEARDRGDQARLALAEHGLTFVDATGSPRVRPEVAIERNARRDFAKLEIDGEPASVMTALARNRRAKG